MAKNVDVGKIGIGPEGRMGGVLQVFVFLAAGLLLGCYLLPPDFIAMKFFPLLLFYLIPLVHLAVAGLGWPLVPPMGTWWAPGKSRVVAGLGMTAILAIFTFIFIFFMTSVYPKWPISPLYPWFGTVLFWATLLYTINWDCWPFRGKMHPWATMFLAFFVNLGITLLIWNFVPNFGGTPFENSPMDPKGPVNILWLTGYLNWAMVWYTYLNPTFTTQGTPFQKLGHPGGAIAQTIVSHILAYVSWTGTLALGMSPTFSSCALMASLLFWSYIHSWHLNFLGVTKFTGGKRAVAAFVVELILALIWVYVSRIALTPIAAKMAALNIPLDVNVLTLYYTLTICLGTIIIHNVFWLRWPLTLPMPPGTPPPDQAE